jgi:histone acetyltransferase (RNA polymerase elongator complex component)
VNKQNGSIQRFDSCAIGQKAAEDVRDIAWKNFECEFPWFDHCDPLIVEGKFSQVRVLYVSTKTSSLEQRTLVDCRFHYDSRQMWIGSIHVVACHRHQGVGRQMVKAAEATAKALGMEKVKILPRSSSVDFWLKLGYTPDSRMTRVLCKNPADTEKNQTYCGVNSWYTSRSVAETI